MKRLVIAIALAAWLVASILLPAPARSDGPPPNLTPVLIPPIACGIPGWSPCDAYRYHVYLPTVERAE